MVKQSHGFIVSVMMPDKMACEIRAMNRLRMMRAGETEEDVAAAKRGETDEG